MSRVLRTVLGCCLTLWLSSAARAEEVKLLAVLPLDVTHASAALDRAAAVSLEESIRDAAANTLSAHGWIVMSSENALQILEDNGIDPTRCGDQTCHLGVARELKVEKFFSGAVLFVDGQLQASIRLIDTKSGRIVGSERVTGGNATALQGQFEAHAPQFFVRCGLIETKAPGTIDPPKPKERVQEPLSNLEFVTRSGLWTTASMVPVDSFARCVWAGACFEPGKDVSERCNWDRRRDDPVNCLDSARAKQFCEWMGGRLPTGAELKRLGRQRADLAAAFFEEGERRGVLTFEAARESELPAGVEKVDPSVGVQCVLRPERVAEL